MRLIALTGGIASGKSTVSARLAELGAVVVDADKLAREVVEPGTAGLAAIEAEFGSSVLTTDGSLNRPALGAIVFAEADKRARLNSITHPAIWQRAQELFEQAVAADPGVTIVYDVPLLAEAAGDRPMQFDAVVVVDAPRQTRIDRLIELRGMSRAEAEARLGAQASDEDRLKLADFVIDNDGSIEHAIEQTDSLWAKLQQR